MSPAQLASILERVDTMSSGPASLRADVRDLVAEVERLRFHLDVENAKKADARVRIERLRREIGALADTKPGATGRALRAILDAGVSS